jgi:hypothetical protein
MSKICWTLVPTSTALCWWRQHVPLRTNGCVHAWHLEYQMLLDCVGVRAHLEVRATAAALQRVKQITGELRGELVLAFDAPSSAIACLLMLRPLPVLLQRPFPSSASALFGSQTHSNQLALREHFGLCPFLQKHLPPPDAFRLYSLQHGHQSMILHP